MPCTPKKTVEQIIESGNDYLIAVKGNQPKLYDYLQAQFAARTPDSVDDQTEQVRDRITQRTVSVLSAPSDLGAVWTGVKRLIRVERTGMRGTEPMHETMFYISSRSVEARQLGEWIRAHWQIENRLHWGKDVVLKEDTAPMCSGHAPENMAILRTIAVNLLRLNGFASLTKGIRAVAHNIDCLFSFCQ
ncbi:MAG: ISAs1 family transposase [Leptolyngbya sp. UWPOB_LEPTO1]|nr:ISAs1 family transposase [Leptolyngbya sp. UWPOB_LEPTO1]MBN8560164.1 ISAs1 family transposase [Leptolyngbya sp. UWPOB_LEPTO1]